MSLNPIAAFRKDTGKRGHFCVHKSDGCRFCYAESINRRFGNGLAYIAPNLDKVEFRVVEKIMREPFSWRKPVRCFPFDMTDWALIAQRNPELMDQWFAVMALTPHVTYQMLTKRPDLALDYLGDMHPGSNRVLAIRDATAEYHAFAGFPKDVISFPLRNVWQGVSAEDQPTADERIPILLQTPASVRFVSYEPALFPVDFAPYLRVHVTQICMEDRTRLECGIGSHHHNGCCLDWIIVGGESGPRARAFDIGWAANTILACRAAGVACFVKQLGSMPVHFARGGNEVPTVFKVKGKGTDMTEWPKVLRVQEFPKIQGGDLDTNH